MLSHLELVSSRRVDRGLDQKDEMWEGELHLMPPPSMPHARLQANLSAVLVPVAEAEELIVATEAGYFDAGRPHWSYRQPDLVVVRSEHVTHRGVEGGAVLVVEIRSPGDESYEKLPFYAAHGAERVMLIEPDDLSVTLFELAGDGYDPAEPDDDGRFDLGFGGLTVATVHAEDGEPGLDLRTGSGDTSATIWLRMIAVST